MIFFTPKANWELGGKGYVAGSLRFLAAVVTVPFIGATIGPLGSFWKYFASFGNGLDIVGIPRGCSFGRGLELIKGGGWGNRSAWKYYFVKFFSLSVYRHGHCRAGDLALW